MPDAGKISPSCGTTKATTNTGGEIEMWSRRSRRFYFGLPPFGFYFQGFKPFPSRKEYLDMLEEYKKDLEEELKELEKEIEETRKSL